MKVLLVNTSYGKGGAAVAVQTLRRGLCEEGHSVSVAVGHNTGEDCECVHKFPRANTFFEKALVRFGFELGLADLGLLGTKQALKTDWFEGADVVNYHNLHGGYLNFLSMPALTRAKPSVLTLHDMWSFTGHCVYSFDCGRWETGCGRCPDLSTYPSMKRDNTRLAWRLKRQAFDRANFHVVAISRWMERLAKRGLLFSKPIHHIPNGIDVSAYAPADQVASRRALGLPEDRPILLFVAHKVEDLRKGFDLLVSAIGLCSPELRRSLLVVVLGEAMPETLRALSCDVRSLGYLAAPELKRQVYTAADCLAFPTRADNLPIVLQEALACGLPAVSYDVGGVPDLVLHGTTGFLAPPEDVLTFSRALQQILTSPELRSEMARKSREFAESEFALEVQARRYVSLFESIIRNRVEHPREAGSTVS